MEIFMKKRNVDSFVFIETFVILFSAIYCRQCTVNQTVTFNSCVNYCWSKYNGTKDFYQFQTGNCIERVICGQGYYNDYQNNICIDEFGGYILEELGYIVKVKEKIVKFAKLEVVRGYTAGNKLVCDDGWKSSLKTQKKSDICLIIYVCDQEIKDGQIYPKMHGQYFFEKLTSQQQLYAIDLALGSDDLSKIFTLQMNALLVFTGLYLFLNLLAFVTAIGRKVNSLCNCFKKDKDLDKNLTESQCVEVRQFLEKRKQQRHKQLGQIKYYSLKDQINQQIELMKAVKNESQEYFKGKFQNKKETKKYNKKQNSIQCQEAQTELKINKKQSVLFNLSLKKKKENV